ncbi:unnamed protein product [Coregonus sp. 'balchen']|nr:unnamed protein product [Coregonus sp. 'balchen']
MLEPYEQQHYDNLHKWMNPKANKERKKPDRVVLDCQERAYWIIHRPPRRTHSAMDYGLDRLIDPNAEEVKDLLSLYLSSTPTSPYHHPSNLTLYPPYRQSYPSPLSLYRCSPPLSTSPSLTLSLPLLSNLSLYPIAVEQKSPACNNKLLFCLIVYQVLTYDVVRRTNIFLTQALMRSAVKSSVSLTAVDTPTKLSVERWVLSFWELISDPRGRVDFKLFLKKEHSAENMAFYEAAEEMRWGAASAIPEKSQFIFNTFLKPGAPRWINIDGRTMGLTVKGLVVPHRYVLDAAQTHIFLLMKKDIVYHYLKSPDIVYHYLKSPDTFYRYLKSPVHKDMQKRALVPAPHVFTDAQLEANARNRNPGISPIILWQQEEEEKAAAAVAARPIDVKAMMATNKLDRK